MRPYFSKDGQTIYHGDCREVLPQLPKADLVLTDPPYGVNVEYLSYEDTEDNWFALMDEVIPLLRAASSMVIFPSCQIKRLKWFYENHPPDWLIAWHKGSPGHVSLVGFNDWEPLIVYGRSKGLCMHDYLSVTNSERMGNYGHPCPKPIKWASWLIARACPADGLLLDPFMGSGTTLVAAKYLDRKAIGIEIEEKYCEIAANRLTEDRPWERQEVMSGKAKKEGLLF